MNEITIPANADSEARRKLYNLRAFFENMHTFKKCGSYEEMESFIRLCGIISENTLYFTVAGHKSRFDKILESVISDSWMLYYTPGEIITKILEYAKRVYNVNPSERWFVEKRKINLYLYAYNYSEFTKDYLPRMKNCGFSEFWQEKMLDVAASEIGGNLDSFYILNLFFRPTI